MFFSGDHKVEVHDAAALNFGCFSVKLDCGGRIKTSSMFDPAKPFLRILMGSSYAFIRNIEEVAGNVGTGYFTVIGRDWDGTPIKIVIKHGEIHTLYPNSASMKVIR